MIIYEQISVGNLFTEGFGTSVENDMTLTVGEGSYNHKTNGGVVSTHFPAFSLDIESDTELLVVCDIYLLAEENEDGATIHVDRTEITDDVMACYEGQTPLLHCLMSIAIPPNTKSLDDLNITVRSIQMVEEGELDE